MKKRVSFIRPINLFVFFTNLFLSFPFLLYTIYPAMGISFHKAFINSLSATGLVTATLIAVNIYIYVKLKPIDALINKPQVLPAFGQEQIQMIVHRENRLKLVLVIVVVSCYICTGTASVVVNTLRDGFLRWATVRFALITYSIGPSAAFLTYIFIGFIMQKVKHVAGIHEFRTKKGRINLKIQFMAIMLSLFLITSLILAFLTIAKQEYTVGISNIAWVINQEQRTEAAQGYFTKLIQLARQSSDPAVKQEAERISAEWESGEAASQIAYILYIWFVVFAFFTFGCFVYISDLSAHLKGVVNSLEKIVGLKGELRSFLIKTSGTEVGEIQTLFNTLILNINYQFRNIFDMATGIISRVKAEKANLQRLIASNEEITTTVKEVSSEVTNQSRISSQTAEGVKAVLGLMDENMSKITEQSAAIEETSAAVSEINSSINSVTNIIRKAAALGDKLSRTSEQGLKLTGTMQESIKKITSSGEGITDMVKVISKIAADTNLLAMNAAIEAAHAGDFGRGFAVVAEEIRRLSENASTQTKQIVKILKDMQQSIRDSGTNSTALNTGMQDIMQDIFQTIDLIKEINQAAEEQSANTSENMVAIQKLVETSCQLAEILETQKSKNKALLESTARMESSVVKIKSVGKNQEEYFLSLKTHYRQFWDFFASTEGQLLKLEEELKTIKLLDREVAPEQL